MSREHATDKDVGHSTDPRHATHMDIRNKLVFLWSHCDFPDTGGVLGASDVSAAQLVHAALLRLFSAVVSLFCSNFC